MRVSAVVLNWRDDARTLRCVSALLSSPEIEHVFVVDNESSGSLEVRLGGLDDANSARWSLSPHIENRGFAAGANGALELSLSQGFDATLLINNDAVIESESVESLVGMLNSNPRLGLVAPRIIRPDGTEESSGGYAKPWLGITTHNGNGRPDFISWACVLVRAASLREVGLLDDSFFMYWEDVDFSYRLRSAGWEFEICAGSSAMHETSTNRRSYPEAIKAYHTWSSILFARKQGGLWRTGNLVWLASSAIVNVARLRIGALRGLQSGVLLAREGMRPAYRSPMRESRF